MWVLNRAFADAEIDNRLKATLHERITAVAKGGVEASLRLSCG